MQARRDLLVLLVGCFVVTLAIGLLVASVVLGVSSTVDRLPMLLVIAAGSSAGFFALLAIVAALDLRRRRMVRQDADQLEQVLRRLGGQVDQNEPPRRI